MFGKRITHGIYPHVLAGAASINGGAEEFAFEPAFGLPVTLVQGPGIMAGQFMPLAVARPMFVLRPAAAPDGTPQQTERGNSTLFEPPEDRGAQ